MSRGIDAVGVDLVVNFNLPMVRRPQANPPYDCCAALLHAATNAPPPPPAAAAAPPPPLPAAAAPAAAGAAAAESMLPFYAVVCVSLSGDFVALGYLMCLF